MDPTYPFFPIASLISAFLILVLMVTNIVRRSWNFGLFMICLGLLCEDIVFGINSVLWANNADPKNYVWCDLATHLQLFGVIVVPAGSFVVTRRLYYAANRHGLEGRKEWQRRFDIGLEVFLLIVLPALYVGLFYYVVQVSRFQIFEDIGCTNAIWGSGMSVLLLDIPTLIPPILSVLLYCPSIIWAVYKQRRQSKRYQSQEDRSQGPNYLRLFAIGCIDIVLTIPVNSIGLFLDTRSTEVFGFYPGWDVVHSDWSVTSVPEDVWRSFGFWPNFTIYFTPWSNVVLSLAIVAIFGSSYELLGIYRRGFTSVAKRLRISSSTSSSDVSTLMFEPGPARSGATSTTYATNILTSSQMSSPNAVLEVPGKYAEDLSSSRKEKPHTIEGPSDG